jgi:GTPase SAR1 family protein
MKKDQSLKSEEHKMVFLMAGNSGVGKNAIINQWKNNLFNHNQSYTTEEDKSYYTSFNFRYEETIDDYRVNFTVELRVLNGDELETEIKSKMEFFKGAYGAFVVTSIDDFMSFQEY